MLNIYIAFLRDLVKDEEGASAVEYGLILGLVAIVIVGVLLTIGTDLNGLFTTTSDCLSAAAGGTGC